MKKGLLMLVPALLLSLTACDLGSLAEKLGGHSDDEETSQSRDVDRSGGNDGGCCRFDRDRKDHDGHSGDC